MLITVTGARVSYREELVCQVVDMEAEVAKPILGAIFQGVVEVGQVGTEMP